MKTSEPSLTLHVPALGELWFRQKMMADPATMAYNAHWRLDNPRYHDDTGCIDFPVSDWADWLAGWAGREPERYYAYIQRADGQWIGEVCFRHTHNEGWWDMGIVLEAAHRGRGYAAPALRLLLEEAFRRWGVTRLHNCFEVTREAAWKAHQAVGFREISVEGGFRQMLLTREEYLAGDDKGKDDGMLTIRREWPEDYPQVEDMIRRAFWNVNVPGCDEHYLARQLRVHEDFMPELDLVAVLDGQIIGSIMYTAISLENEQGQRKRGLTFGPVCVEPAFQRQGYGKRLMEASFRRAVEMGYDAIVIFGSPANYVSRGFKSCRRLNVSLPDGGYPTAMMVKELIPGALAGHAWHYHESPAFSFDPEEARRYDDTLPPMERMELPCQEEFYILSRSSIR